MFSKDITTYIPYEKLKVLYLHTDDDDSTGMVSPDKGRHDGVAVLPEQVGHLEVGDEEDQASQGHQGEGGNQQPGEG